MTLQKPAFLNATAEFAPEVEPAAREMIRQEWELLSRITEFLLRILPRSMRVQYDRELLELRDDLAEAREEDAPQIIALMDSLASLADHHEQGTPVFPLRLGSPYFGHVRFIQEGKEREVLVGSSALLDTELPMPIVDWRQSPVSKLYYSYRQGDSFEVELGGSLVSGEILAHRTLTIRGGVLLRVESELGIYRRSGNLWGPAERALPRLGGGIPGDGAPADPHPSALKSAVPQPAALHNVGAFRADKTLPQITALIDPHQFALITRPDSGVVVIDGGAGSGKTTIALHRLAYLCANDPRRFRPESMLAVVFNRALARYIAHLLPALGAEGVRIEVYEEFAAQLRRRHYPDLTATYCESTPYQVVRFKQHPALPALFAEHFARWERALLDEAREALADTESADRFAAAWEHLADQPPVRRLERILRWATGKIKLPGLGAFGKDWLAQRRLAHVLTEVLPDPNAVHSVPAALLEDVFLRLDLLVEAMERLAPGEFTENQLAQVHAWALRGHQQREAYRAWRRDLHDNGPAPGGEAHEDDPAPPQLDREDDTLLLHLYAMLVGPLRGRKQKRLTVRHLMVDEAQDFGLLELRLLLDLAAEPRSVTLAGDTAQRMWLHTGFASWEIALREMGIEGASVSPLRVGYRCTREIMEFATHALGGLGGERPWEATRHGAPVELLVCTDVGHAVVLLGDALRTLLRAEPTAYVALIARYPEQADAYHQGLLQVELPHLRRVADQDFAFEPGIEVTDVYQVKGLEFDYVILLDVDQDSYGDDPLSRHLLHVGATRAAHQLWLVACREPSPLLPAELTPALE